MGEERKDAGEAVSGPAQTARKDGEALPGVEARPGVEVLAVQQGRTEARPAALGKAMKRPAVWVVAQITGVALGLADWLSSPWRRVGLLAGLATLGLVFNPPVKAIPPGEVALRTSRLTGDMKLFHEGGAIVVPLIHELRRFSLRDQVYRPGESTLATDRSAYQSLEGLPIGLQVTVRWSLDPERILTAARRLPDDVGGDLVGPTVDGVLHRMVAQKTVREIFTGKRMELAAAVEKEVGERLAPDGVLLKSLAIGSVDLPHEYKQGLEQMLSEELANDRMHVTLELKEKLVRQTELEAQAEAKRSLTEAEARGQQQVIAAKAQAEAMKHVLPFKEKEIQQKRMEAEARGIERTTEAKAAAQARVMEAEAEATARHKLAEADVFKAEQLGRVASEQMARDAEVISKNPLLIQKAFAEKLSEHLQVVVAPPSSSGFFAQSLLNQPVPGQVAARAAQGDGQ